MNRKRLLPFLLVIITTLQLSAQNAFEFVENKGQWDSRVKFKGELSSGAFFLRNTGFTVLLHHPTDLRALLHRDHGSPATAGKKVLDKDHGPDRDRTALTLRSHSYNVQFIGANLAPQLLPEKPLPSFNNYFIGNDPSKWASNVKLYHAIVYKNIYPNIDVRYYSDNDKLKYDLIVHPGGDVNKIVLKYEGATSLSIRNRELIIKTSVGNVKEQYPYSYQSDPKSGRKEIITDYVLGPGNTVKFNVRNHNPAATLVIDPSLVFSSFTGSPANQYGFTATPAPDGSLFSGGIVFAPGFPTTPGAYQGTYRGGGIDGIDIGIMKFSPNGAQRLYATYLGGGNDEYPHSLFSDPQGNLVVMGRTYSGDTYPGRLEGTGGGADIIVTKLNAAGSALIGSMRIGGNGLDGVNIEDIQQTQNQFPNSLIRNYGDDSRSEVILDGLNNIYVAAQTKSDSFPIRGGGFQPLRAGGQDGVVLKISPNCDALLWSSYLGGNKDDGAFVLSLNPVTGNLYVAGATASDDFPGNMAGTIGTSYAGAAADGFVAIINPSGTALLQSTYLGTAGIDIIYGIQFDQRGFPYVMGTCRNGTWPVTTNVLFSNPGSSQFVSKLRPDLSGYVYSTVFGSGSPIPNMSPVAFLVDRCENVYISGWGGWMTDDPDRFQQAGVAGMPTTPDAIKRITDNMDLYFIVIKKNAESLLYGTFFGQDGPYGEHVDGGTSRFDQQGVIYQAICANCGGGATYPTTPGVVGPTNRAGAGGGCNLAALKISFNFAGVDSGPKAYFNGVQDTSGCAPFTILLRDTVRNAKSYIWDYFDGSPSDTTTNFEITHTFNNVGDYRVRLIAIDSSTCNIRDTSYINIRVRDNIALPRFIAAKQPPCESLGYLFTNQSVAPPGIPFRGTSFTWDFGDGSPRVTAGPGPVTHSYQNPGTYRVRLILTDTSYCNAVDSTELEIRVNPLVDARFLTPATGCVPYDAYFENTSLAGQSFFWDFGDGTTSNAVNPTHLYPNPGTYIVRMVAIDSSTCNIIDSTSTTITVSTRPTANFTVSPVPPEVNKPTIFFNASIGGVQYKYLFGDGDSTIRTNMDTVHHQYNATGTYTACLITTNAAGCTDTFCLPVDAIIVPLLDVPNAFTPGKFGRNSVVRVEGFGIGRMTFRIYNRWGQKVFEAFDRKFGWDGTFKGQIQPMDVYAYTLDVEFTDGTKARKTGDITLIR